MKSTQTIGITLPLIATFLLGAVTGHGDPDATVNPETPQTVVCVPPFTERGQVAEDRHLGAALTEEVRSYLVRQHSIQVGPSDCGVPGLDFLRLEGSVSSEGERYRVAATLFSSATQRYTWSEQYDRQFDAGTDDIAKAITAAVVNVADSSNSLAPSQ